MTRLGTQAPHPQANEQLGNTRELVGTPPRGLERDTVSSCNNNDLENPQDQGAAECAADSGKTPEIDADLWRVVDAWADLPEAVRVGIVAMVEAAKR